LKHSEDQNSITAIIPFFNEELHLKNVINKVLNFVDILILVNDGSNDNSVKNIPKNDKIIILHHKFNKGKGAALKTGFEKSVENNSMYTITLDADSQHDPEIIPKFIEKLKKYDCVIGARNFGDRSMPLHRKLSNYLTSKLLSIKTGHSILDSQSGYRAFRTKILDNILPTYSGFEAESEMIVKMAKKEYSIGYQTITTVYHNDGSKMKTLPTILGFVKVILKA